LTKHLSLRFPFTLTAWDVKRSRKMESRVAISVEPSLESSNTIGKNIDGRIRRVAEDLKLRDEISHDRGGKMSYASDYFIMVPEMDITRYSACECSLEKRLTGHPSSIDLTS
jgi:hypothetical protein